MKAQRLALLLLIVTFLVTGACRSSDTITVKKPRYHKTWPQSHAWHKKLVVWKFKVQMPERGGLKDVKMHR